MAQFRLAFDFIGGPGRSTTINIGTFLEYGDMYTGTVDSNSTNTSIAINYMPEPGTAILVGLGLAGLARADRRNKEHAVPTRDRRHAIPH